MKFTIFLFVWQQTKLVSSFVTSKSQILLLLLLRKYHKVFLANIWVGQPMKMQEKYFQKPTEWKLTMLQVQKSGWQHRFSSCLFKCVVKLLGIGNRQLTWLQSCLKIPKIHRTVHNWFVFFFFFPLLQQSYLLGKSQDSEEKNNTYLSTWSVAPHDEKHWNKIYQVHFFFFLPLLLILVGKSNNIDCYLLKFISAVKYSDWKLQNTVVYSPLQNARYLMEGILSQDDRHTHKKLQYLCSYLCLAQHKVDLPQQKL